MVWKYTSRIKMMEGEIIEASIHTWTCRSAFNADAPIESYSKLLPAGKNVRK